MEAPTQSGGLGRDPEHRFLRQSRGHNKSMSSESGPRAPFEGQSLADPISGPRRLHGRLLDDPPRHTQTWSQHDLADRMGTSKIGPATKFGTINIERRAKTELWAPSFATFPVGQTWCRAGAIPTSGVVCRSPRATAPVTPKIDPGSTQGRVGTAGSIGGRCIGSIRARGEVDLGVDLGVYVGSRWGRSGGQSGAELGPIWGHSGSIWGRVGPDLGSMRRRCGVHLVGRIRGVDPASNDRPLTIGPRPRPSAHRAPDRRRRPRAASAAPPRPGRHRAPSAAAVASAWWAARSGAWRSARLRGRPMGPRQPGA